MTSLTTHGFVNNGHAYIPKKADERYRKELTTLVAQDGGATACKLIAKALTDGPSLGGYIESAQYFGREFQIKLELTALCVEACEIAIPGFKHWLELTGFGNDLTMIKGFVAWAEAIDRKVKVRPQLVDEMRKAKL